MAKRYLALVVGCLVAGLAVVGISDDASAGGGDHNHNTYGEDGRNYFENNNNPFDDDCLPGQPSRSRSGVQW
ncbi:MAG: hypothetical protein WBD03_02690 [Thermoplasmata archaeon]